MKVLIDTNVLIDFLTKRNQTFYESAGKIINYCFCKKIKGCIAAHTVMNSFYVLRKIYTLSQMRNIFLHLSQHIDYITEIFISQGGMKIVYYLSQEIKA